MRLDPIIPIAPLLAIVAPAAAGGPVQTLVETDRASLLVRAERSTLTTAQTVRLRLEAEAPPGASVQWPDLGEKLGAFTIVDHLGLPPKRTEDGRRVVSRVYTLAPFLAGEYEIPPLEVRFVGPGEEEMSLRSQPLRIEVTSVLDDPPSELSVGEPLGPAALPESPSPDPWPWIAGGVGVAVALAAGAAVAIQRRGRGEGPAADPVRTARAGLAQLAVSGASGSAPAAQEIDDLVRPALARLLGSREAGATSAELNELARRLVPAEALARVYGYLASADEALFSDRAGDGAELLRQATEAIESLVAWRESLREATS